MSKPCVKTQKGRPIPWTELRFERQKGEKGSVSKCLNCLDILKNTSHDRLLAHRKICKLKPTDDLRRQNQKETPEVPLKRRKENLESNTSGTPETPGKILSEIDESLATFFFGCNIPFSTVESDHFKSFIHHLNPNYKPPSRKTLSGSILDKLHSKILEKNSLSINESSVLLLDGWKNSSKNEKYVVGTLHNANGEKVFLNSWDFTEQKETAKALKEVADAAAIDAKEIYDTDIYALVSDNVSSMICMGKLIDYWHVTCNSHSGNLLAKNLVESSFSAKTVPVLKEFKSPGLERELTRRGGIRICLPGDTRWCSYRDSFRCFLRNLSLMRNIVQEGQHSISVTSASLILDEEYERELIQFVVVFDEVCKLINKCQSDKSNIADAVEDWLLLQFPVCNEKYESLLPARLEKVIRPIGLAANILHPVYRGRVFANNAKYNEMANNFLKENLDKTGTEDLAAYLNNEGIFKTLEGKNLKDPETFWCMAEAKHPALSELAKKLMKIPSSTAAIERLFSQWSFVHNKLRNRLCTETSKKLIYIYYTLRMKDTNVSDDY